MNPTVLSSSLFVYHDLISAIVAAMEARDRYTASHSRRVSDMSEEICRLLGVSGELTEKIHIAADLHDIGKLGIADSVLMREGPLGEDEWRCMKQHPVIGFDILNKVSSFRDIAIIVRHHHERWDGCGYPDGLAGQDIPLGARIIAVADSIDAMMSDRLYRQKMSAGKCKNELIKNSGAMYDPQLVELVVSRWGKNYRRPDAVSGRISRLDVAVKKGTAGRIPTVPFYNFFGRLSGAIHPAHLPQ